MPIVSLGGFVRLCGKRGLLTHTSAFDGYTYTVNLLADSPAAARR